MPERQVRDVRAEAAERHRLRVRRPGETVVGNPREDAPGRPHLVIEFRQQPVPDRHAV